jgi:uncharacterized protein
MALLFEWDPAKAEANIQNHKVSFNEAVTVFDDDQGITIFDPDHSETEDRFILFGRSALNRYLMVVHLDMFDSDIIRIISARKMTSNERKGYEKEILRRNGV